LRPRPAIQKSGTGLVPAAQPQLAPRERAIVDNLNARVRAWWSMVAVFAVAFLRGKNARIAMFALISFLRCVNSFHGSAFYRLRLLRGQISPHPCNNAR